MFKKFIEGFEDVLIFNTNKNITYMKNGFEDLIIEYIVNGNYEQVFVMTPSDHLKLYILRQISSRIKNIKKINKFYIETDKKKIYFIQDLRGHRPKQVFVMKHGLYENIYEKVFCQILPECEVVLV